LKIGFKGLKKLRKIKKLLSAGLKRIPHKREKIESYVISRDFN